jgi:DNA polymerase-3 subunit beta
MEFSVKRSDLLDELEMTQGVVERKTTIPILSNLLVEAKGSRLTITATDLERRQSKEGRRGNHSGQETF